MDREKIMQGIADILAGAGIEVVELIEFLSQDQKEKDEKPSRDPVEVLIEGLVLAKDITGMEYDEIGARVNHVTGGAVGHWIRGRTRPHTGNQVALYHWLRSVEDALGVEVLPPDFHPDRDQRGSSISEAR